MSSMLRNTMVRQLIRFAIVGFANTVVDWAIFFALTSWFVWFSEQPLVANAIAFIAGFTNSFIFNRIWTFQSADQKRVRQMTRFFLVALIGLLLSEVVIAILLPLTDSRLLSKCAAVAVTLTWNFIGGKFWAFRA